MLDIAEIRGRLEGALRALELHDIVRAEELTRQALEPLANWRRGEAVEIEYVRRQDTQ